MVLSVVASPLPKTRPQVIYQANVSLLQAMGAGLVYFSPWPMLTRLVMQLVARQPPELYAKRCLTSQFKKDIKAAQQTAKPILAECGGFLYYLEALVI